MSEHWMTVRTDYQGQRYWRGTSVWDLYLPQARVRTEQSRSTDFYDEKKARRWARRYKVEFPTEPEGSK